MKTRAFIFYLLSLSCPQHLPIMTLSLKNSLLEKLLGKRASHHPQQLSNWGETFFTFRLRLSSQLRKLLPWALQCGAGVTPFYPLTLSPTSAVYRTFRVTLWSSWVQAGWHHILVLLLPCLWDLRQAIYHLCLSVSSSTKQEDIRVLGSKGCCENTENNPRKVLD